MAEEFKESLRTAALRYHAEGKPGKLEIRATKPLANGRDLARAYSPGVADACTEIVADKANANRYTARGNLWPWSPMARLFWGLAISVRWPPSR